MTLLSYGFAMLLLQAEKTTTGLKLTPEALIRETSAVGLGVIAVLLIMSIYSIAIMCERYLTFNAAANQSRAFIPKATAMIKAAQIDDALQLSRQFKKSHLAMVVNSGLQELAITSTKNPLRKAKRALQRSSAIKIAEMQKGLSSLATIGSTAPFVGLFGTVVGIINAFTKMNEAETAGISVVAGGIAEALITTAFGLVVAIPAVWMFNYFTARVNNFAIEMKNSADELLEFFVERQSL